MEETFFTSLAIPKEKLKKLSTKQNNPTFLLFCILFLLIFISSYWVVISWNKSWIEIFLSHLFLSILCCSQFAFLHEIAHSTAFKSKSLTKVAGILGGITHLYPISIFRDLHFTHHRYTHIPGKDPEISLGNKPLPSVIQSIPSFLIWLTGIPLLIFKISMVIFGAFGMPNKIRLSIYPFIRKESRLNIFIESWLILIVNGFLLYLAVTKNSGFYGLFISQIIGHCILSYYLTPEHNGLPYDGSILEKTRSLPTNRFVNLMMWNMPYHAEHHAFPSVPFFNLTQLHNEMKNELIHTTENHTSFHKNVLLNKYK